MESLAKISHHRRDLPRADVSRIVEVHYRNPTKRCLDTRCIYAQALMVISSVQCRAIPMGQALCMTYATQIITAVHYRSSVTARTALCYTQTGLLEPAQRHPAQSCIHLLSFLQVLVGSYFGKSIFGKRHQTEMLQRPHA